MLKVWDETWMKDVEKAFRKSGKSKSVVKKFMKTWKHNFLKLKSDAEQGSILINLNWVAELPILICSSTVYFFYI